MFITWLKNTAKRLLRLAARLVGQPLHYKHETDALLTPYVVDHTPEQRVLLPTIGDSGTTERTVFDAKEAVTLPTYVWHLPTTPAATRVLRSGAVSHRGTVLCTDYWTHHVVKDSLRPRRRTVVHVETVVAPFSHYPDMMAFGGYYDYIYLIFAKLCRIEQTRPGGFAGVAITYPLFHTAYEAELLTLLGFTPDRIFDSRAYELRANTYLLGNGGDWFYPNQNDVVAARQRLAPLLPNLEVHPAHRLYISRAGRRRIVNEEALMRLLEPYGFSFVEDRPRSLAEQLNLYQGASFIIGPHGASFSNISWCQPGTYLHELCSVNYAPDFFLYLATLRQMVYSASLHGVVRRQSIAQSLVEDITVSIPTVERILPHWLNSQLQPTERVQ